MKREIAVNGSQNQKIINNVQSISPQGSLLNRVLGVLTYLPCLRVYVLGLLACLAYFRDWCACVLVCLRAWCACVHACVLVIMKCFIFLRVCVLGVLFCLICFTFQYLNLKILTATNLCALLS